MLAAFGMVLMVIGGLLLLSAVRSYALYRANQRRLSTRVAGEPWLKFLVSMLFTGAAFSGLGYALAF